LTGFRTYQEFVDETTPEEKQLIMHSIKAWHEKRDGGGHMTP